MNHHWHKIHNRRELLGVRWRVVGTKPNELLLSARSTDNEAEVRIRAAGRNGKPTLIVEHRDATPAGELARSLRRGAAKEERHV